MSVQHVLDELSAYMDGECQDVHRIERHLQSCPDCARRHMELLRLSNHLKAVRRPNVDPDFAGRVFAAVAIRGQASSWRFGRTRPLMRVAALVASFVVIGVGAAYVFWLDADRFNEPVPVAADNSQDATVPLLAAETLLKLDVWTDPFVASLTEDTDVSTPSVEVLIEALATWTLDEESAAWYETEDMFSVMEVLSRENVSVLDALASNHWDSV